MLKLDLVIRNGEIVNATGKQGRANIGILNGCIIQIGGEMEGERELDAGGRLVIPGGIDAHVHLSLSPQNTAMETNPDLGGSSRSLRRIRFCLPPSSDSPARRRTLWLEVLRISSAPTVERSNSRTSIQPEDMASSNVRIPESGPAPGRTSGNIVRPLQPYGGATRNAPSQALTGFAGGTGRMIGGRGRG